MQLEALQSSKNLHAGTKLQKRHIYFNDKRTNVKLAAQTLSESVCNALKFVQELGSAEFKDCLPTAQFYLIFNNIFDILNCRSKFSLKQLNRAINSTSYNDLR